jgi:pumilio RNA-binding family
LSFCQFGNYLIQHLAEKGTDSYKSILADMIADNVIEMSFDKFASNVVEKAVSNWNLDFIERLFEELKKPNRNNPNL